MSRIGQRKFIEFVSLMLLSPVYLLVKLIPKNRNLYIYGSSLGLHFADNSKYLFLYTSKNINKIKSVFISRNKEVVDLLEDNGYSAEYLYSLKGVVAVIRAKKAFLSHSAKDIHPLLLGGTEVIQLWHGTPLKKIGYDADWRSDSTKIKMKYVVRRIIYFIFPYMYSSRWFDTIVASSAEVAHTYQTAFGIARNRIDVIGQPRNDCFDKSFEFDSKIFKEIDYLENLKKKYETLISWLPTHRGLSGKTLVDLMDKYKFDNPKFTLFLQENNIGFIIKPHFLEKDDLLNKKNICENLIVYDFVDPYPLLRYTDILITDYSSVFF